MPNNLYGGTYKPLTSCLLAGVLGAYQFSIKKVLTNALFKLVEHHYQTTRELSQTSLLNSFKGC